MAEGHQLSIWVSVVVPWLAALLALVLRLVARRMTKVGLGWDDLFSILAFAFATGYCGIMVEWTLHTYLGANIPYSLPAGEFEAILTQSRFLSLFNSICYATSIACSKAAILILYWRLFKTSKIRIPIQILLGVVGVWFILRTFMLIFRCVPVQSLWDYTITNKVCNIDSAKFFLGTITTHFLLDIIILVLPVIEVFNLRMRMAQKVAVSGLFLVGTIVCIASAFVLAELVKDPEDPKQQPYNYAMFCVWGSVEVNIAIVGACFPLLRPVVSRLVPEGILSSYDKKRYNNQYGISGQGYHISGTSHPRSRNTRGISTFVRSRHDMDDDVESGSTTQLHELKPDTLVQTVVTGKALSTHTGETSPGRGITVHHDTVVEVEQKV